MREAKSFYLNYKILVAIVPCRIIQVNNPVANIRLIVDIFSVGFLIITIFLVYKISKQGVSSKRALTTRGGSNRALMRMIYSAVSPTRINESRNNR